MRLIVVTYAPLSLRWSGAGATTSGSVLRMVAGDCCAHPLERLASLWQEPPAEELAGTLQPGNLAGQGSGSAGRDLSQNLDVGERVTQIPDGRQRLEQPTLVVARLLKPGPNRRW